MPMREEVPELECYTKYLGCWTQAYQRLNIIIENIILLWLWGWTGR